MPTAIVPGGNSGIGRATAVALAARGFDIGIAWHEHEDRARDAVAEYEAHGVHQTPLLDLDAKTFRRTLELGGHGIR